MTNCGDDVVDDIDGDCDDCCYGCVNFTYVSFNSSYNYLAPIDIIFNCSKLT